MCAFVPSRASADPALRTGTSPLELAAAAAVARDVASYPAALVVSLLLWPETIADWARGEGVTPPLVHNALAHRKPFTRLRQLLAERLDVPTSVLGHLIETPRPVPDRLRPPVPSDASGPGWHWGPGPGERPRRRDGTNPLERKAVLRVERDRAAMPVSQLVQLLLQPTTLAAWCRAEGQSPSLTYALLAGTQRAPRIERALARRLGLDPAVLRHCLEAEPVPVGVVATQVLEAVTVRPSPPLDAAARRRAAPPPAKPARPPPRDQLDLGLLS